MTIDRKLPDLARMKLLLDYDALVPDMVLGSVLSSLELCDEDADRPGYDRSRAYHECLGVLIVHWYAQKQSRRGATLAMTSMERNRALLFLACSFDLVHATRFLLHEGVDPNQRDQCLELPLVRACRKHTQPGCVKLLLEAAAAPNPLAAEPQFLHKISNGGASPTPRAAECVRVRVRRGARGAGREARGEG